MKVWLFAIVFAAASVARADDVRPWARGVDVAEQARADELLAVGNALLDQGLVTQALESYRDALRHWDHPAIRYNLAIALIELGRPLDALDEIERALRFGPDALEPEVYRQALAYRGLLEQQSARLTISCAVPGARVSLDGIDLLHCPGSVTKRVLAGPHRILGESHRYLARSISLALAGGSAKTVDLDLITLDDARYIRRRWAVWKPWVMVGASIATVGIGVGVELQARATLRSYDNAVATLCPEPCADLPVVVEDAYDRSHIQHAIGVTALTVGGLALIAGAVLVIVNRTRVEYRTYPAIVTTPGHGHGLAVAVPF